MFVAVLVAPVVAAIAVAVAVAVVVVVAVAVAAPVVVFAAVAVVPEQLNTSSHWHYCHSESSELAAAVAAKSAAVVTAAAVATSAAAVVGEAWRHVPPAGVVAQAAGLPPLFEASPALEPPSAPAVSSISALSPSAG